MVTSRRDWTSAVIRRSAMTVMEEMGASWMCHSAIGLKVVRAAIVEPRARKVCSAVEARWVGWVGQVEGKGLETRFRCSSVS